MEPSLPRNATDRPRVLVHLSGEAEVRNESASGDLTSLAIETAVPIRRFYSWKGKRNYEGEWWSSTVGGHVKFESLLEREFLMVADYTSETVSISSQPLALLWPRGTEGQKSHVPDFFCRLSSGDGRLIDVKHPDRVEKAAGQFAMTREICEQIGWQYEVFTGLLPNQMQSLRWISGYRQDRYAPRAEDGAEILEAFSTPMPLQNGIRRASRKRGKPRELILANVYHLLWHRLLSANMNAPLTMGSEVWA